MASIALAIHLKDKIGEILITDGNQECCESIKANLKLNEESISQIDKVKIKQIVWDEQFR